MIVFAVDEKPLPRFVDLGGFESLSYLRCRLLTILERPFSRSCSIASLFSVFEWAKGFEPAWISSEEM